MARCMWCVTAAVMIQSAWRSSSECRKYRTTLAQVVTVQTYHRAFHARKAFLRSKYYITKIQAIQRRRMQQQDLM